MKNAQTRHLARLLRRCGARRASAPASEDSRKRRRSIRGVVSQILDIDAVAESPDPRAMLLAELEDFVIRHRPCGQPTGDATEPEPDGYIADGELLLRRQLPAVGDAGGAMRELVMSDLLTTG